MSASEELYYILLTLKKQFRERLRVDSPFFKFSNEFCDEMAEGKNIKF